MKPRFFKPNIILLLLGLGLFSVAPCSFAADAEIHSEVLLFVDVSGSMIKNDPNNVRAPAIRLLSGMAPENARVGIFLFGTEVRSLVLPDKVNRSWQAMVEKKSKQFRSRDMYSNIEAALLTANQNWSDSQTSKRSVILLTDGIVDIDKNTIVSDASRSRILDSVLSDLQQNKVTVNTIALSKNADHELLKELALKTDGANLQVENASELQRSFMQLFEQSAPRDTVPLQDNRFVVDESISELTLLVFRKENSKATEIVTPEGEVYHHGYNVDGLVWKKDNGYDLISVNHPIPGEWKIIADEDPDNRAMIVTDLKMNTSEFPKNLLKGEQPTWNAWMEEDGKRINKPEFLDLLSATLKNARAQTSFPMPLDKENAQFSYTFDGEIDAGVNDIVLTIDSGTFTREKRASVHVYSSPFEITHQLMDEETIAAYLAKRKKTMPTNLLAPGESFEPKEGWEISIKPLTELLETGSSNVKVEIKTQSGKIEKPEAEKEGNNWVVHHLPNEPGENEVRIQFNAKTAAGRDIAIEAELIKLGTFVDLASLNEKELTEEVAPLTEDKPVFEIKDMILPLVAGNIFFVMIFLGWKFYKRMRQNTELQPEEAL